MPKGKIPSIPLELQQKKAHEFYLERLSQGLNDNSEEDWEKAREYLVNHPKEIWIWRAYTFPQNFLYLIWRILSFPFCLFWKLSLLLNESETKAFSLDVIKTQITALGLIATFVAGIGLSINYWSSEKNIQLTQERLVTERFSKAIEQMGSNKEEVVLGGIYSLERIAKDSPEDQSTIVEVLSSFIRKNSPVKTDVNESDKIQKELINNTSVSIPLQAVLTVIGRRTKLEKVETVDLRKSNLSKANLSGADLSRADLSEADLRGADLSRADLSRADLRRADLSGANLLEADLSGANLLEADLSGANLLQADLRGADLIFANLSRVNLIAKDLINLKTIRIYQRIDRLSGVNLSEADLTFANLREASLNFANLIEAALIGADLSRADLSRADLNGADLNGANLREADLSGADLSGADLSKSKNLTQKQIESALTTENTKLPNGLKSNSQNNL